MVRVVSDRFRSTEGYRNPLEVIGPHGPNVGREVAGQGVARALPPSPNRIGLGGGPPFLPLLPSPLPPSFPPPSRSRKGESYSYQEEDSSSWHAL